MCLCGSETGFSPIRVGGGGGRGRQEERTRPPRVALDRVPRKDQPPSQRPDHREALAKRPGRGAGAGPGLEGRKGVDTWDLCLPGPADEKGVGSARTDQGASKMPISRLF